MSRENPPALAPRQPPAAAGVDRSEEAGAASDPAAASSGEGDPPKAGEGRQEHARPLARSPPLLPFAPRSSLRAGAAAAALPILLLLLLLLRREQRVLEGIAGKPGTVAAALQGGTCSE
ncbi:hypothetical protein SORBI_3010G229025 [Sorghum bicolor]|uniref:Uncharacterized protein n=1 Tax=Sorghum bicolor TaxID=4558 RepID=A0A194YKX9_SORBI|nr:hypothetical protein SORBI_3010G229025 [Sorghum bicolor]